MDLWQLIGQKRKKENGSLRVVAVISAVIFDKIMAVADTLVMRKSTHSLGCTVSGRKLTPTHVPLRQTNTLKQWRYSSAALAVNAGSQSIGS